MDLRRGQLFTFPQGFRGRKPREETFERPSPLQHSTVDSVVFFYRCSLYRLLWVRLLDLQLSFFCLQFVSFTSGGGTVIGRTPKGSHSPRGRSRHLPETPFSEPLLRTLLRTFFTVKPTGKGPPSQNPSENPFPRTFPEPFLERLVLPYALHLENSVISLNKEVRPFFLGDYSIWSFPSLSSLSDYS